MLSILCVFSCMGFLFFSNEKKKDDGITKALTEYCTKPNVKPKSAPVIDALKMLLTAHRKVIVLYVDETQYTPDERRQADRVGAVLYRESQEKRELIIAALTAIATNRHPARHGMLSEVLDFIEADASLFDADRLCYKEILVDLAGALMKDQSLTAVKMHKRVNEDISAVNEIEQMYNKEISHIFGRFADRGIVRRREKWNDYIERLKKIHRRDLILKEYSVIEPIKPNTAALAEITGRQFPDKTIMLTFDDGPHYAYSEEIASILKHYAIPGVFFTMGAHLGEIGTNGKARLSRLSAVSRNLIAQGHQIANHSYMHEQLNKITADRASNEIYRTQQMLTAIGASNNRLFRFPYGESSADTMKIVTGANLVAMGWNIDSRDWADPIPNSIVERVLGIIETEKKGILLFHDINERTVKALPVILDRLVSEGYRFARWEGDQCVAQNPASNAALDAVPSCGYNRSYAVVIGIDDYAAWPKLQYAVKDAESVASLLVTSFGFQKDAITILKNGEATRKGIIDTLTARLSTLAKNQDDRVFIFFAGHGTTVRLNSGRDLGYIIPADASASNIIADAIPMSDLQHISESLTAKHVFFVMDCCYSGLGLTRGMSMQNYLRDNATRLGRQMLTAGGADQLVADSGPGGHSVFTWTLLQGLEGKADLNGDGFITATELAAYVAPAVASISHQTPAFGSMPGSKGGEFVFELPASTEYLSAQSTQMDDAARKLQQKIDVSLSSNTNAQVSVKTIDGPNAELLAVKPIDVPPAQAALRANDRGLQSFKEARYDEAAKHFTEALKHRPGFSQAANNLGYVFFQDE